MKSKDKFTIVIVAIFSAVVSIILSGILIGDGSKNQTVEVIEPISAELVRPPTEYYNSNAINPTQTIQIGGGSTNQPFGGQ